MKPSIWMLPLIAGMILLLAYILQPIFTLMYMLADTAARLNVPVLSTDVSKALASAASSCETGTAIGLSALFIGMLVAGIIWAVKTLREE